MARYQQQKLEIYNSLSGKKEVFKPLLSTHVGMYVCGPTVYSNVHLGNMRTFMSFDVIYRYLKHLDYKVRYVRNITDAGHLENDADVGEDRISKKARLEEIEPMEVVQRYTIDFHSILEKLNCLPPSIEPTATGHIVEQIQIIEQIIDNGFAYEVNESVYFDVLKYNESYKYGILNNRDIENLVHNSRELDGQSDKKNPQDFALWKKAEPQHIMRWTSPWGDGFPGWHLECTAMSTKYLGKEFDIHGGGMDLKFPHHECEIAQGQSVNHTSPVRYWLHTNMLTLNGKKMAKSTGNNVLPNDIFSGENPFLEKPFSPSVIRFFMLQAHYRSILDFSNQAIVASEKGYERLMDAINVLEKLTVFRQTSTEIEVLAMIQGCYDAMNDDFNTPILIAKLFDIVKTINQINDGKLTISQQDRDLLLENINFFVKDVMGLRMSQSDNDGDNQEDKLSEVMEVLISLRNNARQSKDFALSDSIRDYLTAIGIELKDDKEGTSFTVK